MCAEQAGQVGAATAALPSPALTRVESLAEEVASAITHGVGLGGAVAAVIWAAVRHRFTGDGLTLFWIYGGSLWLLYLCSTLYHSLTRTPARAVFKVLDHSAIYVLIAGTYTPMVPAIASTRTAWVVLAVVWTCAIVGITLSAVFYRRQTRLVKGLELGAYVGLGWVALALVRDFWQFGHPWFIAYLLAGGVFYTAGTYFYGRRSLRFNHSYWHIAVLAGSALHFAAVLQL
jgi:hemolysin III